MEIIAACVYIVVLYTAFRVGDISDRLKDIEQKLP